MSTTDVAECVARGAALLDEKIPNWDRQIDLDSFFIGATCNCVVGQLFRRLDHIDPYQAGVRELGLTVAEECEHGFWASEGISWHSLDDEWVRVITERRPAS